uniref:uncharacterized protein LOC100183067 isoform X3 n=1 Tax=Ciona intestinalis TaxID=7719 RepID=UPI0005214BBB|nr:uncharacterized protein LOC100183067 isoform X3 [Ciona intestinalis]|eukprot:XP_009862180.1 uncharacterized protein LOC100183067 isoform X3 [Ciona intestinalis]
MKQSTIATFFNQNTNDHHSVVPAHLKYMDQPVFSQKSKINPWNAHMYSSVKKNAKLKAYHKKRASDPYNRRYQDDDSARNSQSKEDSQNFYGSSSQSQDSTGWAKSFNQTRLSSAYSSMSSLNQAPRYGADTKPFDEDFRPYMESEKTKAKERAEREFSHQFISKLLEEHSTKVCEKFKKVSERMTKFEESQQKSIESFIKLIEELKSAGKLRDIELKSVQESVKLLQHKIPESALEILSSLAEVKKSHKPTTSDSCTQYSPQVCKLPGITFSQRNSPISVVNPVQSVVNCIKQTTRFVDKENYGTPNVNLTSHSRLRSRRNLKDLSPLSQVFNLQDQETEGCLLKTVKALPEPVRRKSTRNRKKSKKVNKKQQPKTKINSGGSGAITQPAFKIVHLMMNTTFSVLMARLHLHVYISFKAVISVLLFLSLFCFD